MPWVIREGEDVSLEIESLKRMLHEEVDQLEDMTTRKRLQYLMVCSSPEKREQLRERMMEVVSDHLQEEGLVLPHALNENEEDRVATHLKELEENGLTRLGPLLSADQAAEIRHHLTARPVYGGATVSQGAETGWGPLSDARKNHMQCCYKLEDLLETPHLLELMASPFIIRLTARYLGAPPTVYSPNLFWSFATPSGSSSPSQQLHRDWDGFRHLALFVYLVDVDRKNGAHQYLQKSHRVESLNEIMRRGRNQDDAPSLDELFYYHLDEAFPGNERLLSLFPEEETTLEGLAGEAFLVDPFGLHRGHPLAQDERLLFWARYSLYHNGNAVDVSSTRIPMEKVGNRIPEDRVHRYMFRTFLESEFSAASGSTLHVPSVSLMEPAPKRFQPRKNGRLELFRRILSPKRTRR